MSSPFGETYVANREIIKRQREEGGSGPPQCPLEETIQFLSIKGAILCKTSVSNVSKQKYVSSLSVLKSIDYFVFLCH